MISIGLFALSDRVKYTQRKPIVFISVMALCLLAGMRAVGVGTDTRVYLMPVYEAAKRSHSIGEYLNSSFHAFTWTTDYVKDMEPLFPLLVLIVTKITGSLYCVQTILELCVILPLYVAVRKDKNTSLGMAMFVFCMAFYNPSMNMMRQSIAMSLGVLGFEYWKNAEKKNAFICVIIAFLFHTSSLLILLIYLLYDYIVKGTTLSITGNSVTQGFVRNLEINGVGYRAAQAGKNLNLSLGFSHPVVVEPPVGIKLEAPAPNKIVVSGIDKEAVGAMAAKIRSYREPEPYKGKGIKYEGEHIRRKAGKTGSKK